MKSVFRRKERISLRSLVESLQQGQISSIVASRWFLSMRVARMGSVTQPTSPASCRGSSGVCVVESSLETAARLSAYVAGCTELRWPCRGHPPVSTVYFSLKKNGRHWTDNHRKTSQTGGKIRLKKNKNFSVSLFLWFWFAALQAEGGFPLMDPSTSPCSCPSPRMMYDVFSVFVFSLFPLPSCLSKVPSSRGPWATSPIMNIPGCAGQAIRSRVRGTHWCVSCRCDLRMDGWPAPGETQIPWNI